MHDAQTAIHLASVPQNGVAPSSAPGSQLSRATLESSVPSARPGTRDRFDVLQALGVSGNGALHVRNAETALRSALQQFDDEDFGALE
jgi:hypothetical protein